MKSRIKIKLPAITTRDEAESVMNELAQAENNRRKFIARRDAEVLNINSQYEGGIAACAEAVREKSDILRAWAEATPEAFPKGRKSLDLVSGVIGFRTGTPKLALLSRAWNWDKVLEAFRHGLKKYIRTKDEVNKDAVLADYATRQICDAELAAEGLKVVQEESFFVEPALTDTDARQTQEAK